jgi:hypothetical protein
MILAFATRLGLLAQVTALAPTPRAAPIRVWIADSTVYVRLRDPGYLTVLHVDPVGRIRVLFPLHPDDTAAAPGGGTFALAAPAGRERGTGTIVAARARQPLQVAGLRAGPAWDYDHGLLFQPTAGNAVAALLDIADRMADGRAFDFDVTTYRTGGLVAAQDPQLRTPVCLTCVRSYPMEQQSTVVLDQSNTVDCSSAVLVNSFCGVVDNRVTNTYVYNEVARAPEPVYVPYYVPVLIIPPRRPPPPSPPQERTLAIAFPLRHAGLAVVPPPPRRKFVIDVQQPRQRHAPIEPRPRDETEPPPPPPPPGAVRAVTALSTPARVAVAPAGPRVVTWVGGGMEVGAWPSWGTAAAPDAESAAPPAEQQARTISLPSTPSRMLVPSGAFLRSMRAKPR